jgi:hypothetical protein
MSSSCSVRGGGRLALATVLLQEITSLHEDRGSRHVSMVIGRARVSSASRGAQRVRIRQPDGRGAAPGGELAAGAVIAGAALGGPWIFPRRLGQRR